jgi:putative Ca2+/H+ antiporter (TMEM165/GDT1 family)
LIGVVIGEGTAQVLPTKLTKLVAATGFAIMALRLLVFGSNETTEE